jgi:Ion channel
MQVFSTIAGTVMVVAVFFDALATTMVVGAGAGPVTRRLTGLLWRAALDVVRGRQGSALLGSAGAAILFVTVMVWVALLWLGWSLILLGGDPAVVDAQTKQAAGLSEVVYYAGFTLFTLGVGDYVAAGQPWRVVTAIAGFSGLFLVTLAITYLVSVVSAVVNRRAVAVHIHALGASAVDIAGRAWTGREFSSAFVQHLVSITEQLSVVAEQHLAYPILHYFHSREPQASAAVAVAQLDDALLLLSAAVVPQARPDDSTVRPVRAAVDRYVATAAMTSSVPRHVDVPPLPDIAALEAHGVPVVGEAAFIGRADAASERRRALHRLVCSDGRRWDAVC